ncbi:LysR family transcriptional regulator [Ruminococcus sp.]|uniref:LysR family transcriptional regulator n=1 Tax=Ruminococcus sp. TaxID=41978 RepID=UPI0039950666
MAPTQANPPPAVIKQINLLESSLNLQLFIRTHRGLQLTEAGKSMYHDAKYVIQYCQESVGRAKNAMQKEDSVIRIGTSPMTPGHFLMNLWGEIHEICPEIKLQLVPFENTPENAREILRNLGTHIDLVCGAFDDAALENWKCDGCMLSHAPLRCAVSIYNPLAQKECLQISDLYGQNFMVIRRGWNENVDKMRDDLSSQHPQIHIVDFDFLNLNVFNQCENSNDLMMCIDEWANVHPLLKVLPVEWEYALPSACCMLCNPHRWWNGFCVRWNRCMENRS